MGFPSWLFSQPPLCATSGERKRTYRLDSSFRGDTNPLNRWEASVLVVVNDSGQITQFGRCVQAYSDQVHLLGLPRLEFGGKHTLLVSLTTAAKSLTNHGVSVAGSLTVVFSPETVEQGGLTNYQELYDRFSAANIWHLDSYLRAALAKVVAASFDLEASFAALLWSRKFSMALQQAINLSNLVSAVLKVDVAVKGRLTVSYAFRFRE